MEEESRQSRVSHTTPTFEKLNGMSNYSDWRFGMEMYLMHEDLWDCIECDENGKVLNADKRKDMQARSKICLMVSPSAYPHVRNAKSAKEAWDSLQKAYQDRGLNSKIDLLQVLMNTKLDNCRNMEAYINKIMTVSHGLAECNSPLDDEFMAAFMLAGLPEEYKPMRMAMENSGIKLTTEYVKSRLLQEDFKQDAFKSTVFLSKGKKHNSKTFSFKQQSEIKCYRCNRFGHTVKQCKAKVLLPSDDTNSCVESTFSQVSKPKHNLNSSKYKSKQMSNHNVSSDKKWSFLTALAVNVDSKGWYIDSGASTHMTNSSEWLSNCNFNAKHVITVANNQKVYSEAIGNTTVVLPNDEEKIISNVMYVPNLSTNLLSVNKMVQSGLAVIFTSNGCQIYREDECYIQGNVLAKASNVGGLYKLDVAEQSNTQVMNEQIFNTVTKTNAEIWHERLGHLNWLSMNVLRKHLSTGLNFSGSQSLGTCISCIEGKMSRLPFPNQSVHRATQKLELIHTDLCGPLNEMSLSGCKYLLTFIDDYSRKTFGYFLKTKDEVFKIFRIFKSKTEKETGLKIKCIRSDNGKEYVNKQFEDFLSENGIKHQKTVKYTPEQNGVAERSNRTIIEKVRCMLQGSGLNNSYWAEAANTAIYLKNRSPSKAVRGFTPEELWTGKKVNLSHLKVFGCIAYAHIPKQLRKKLDPKAKKYVFTGYCEDTKGYRLIDPEDPQKVEISRDVVFIENMFLKQKLGNECNKVPLLEILSNTTYKPNEGSNGELLSSNEISFSDNNSAAESLNDSIQELVSESEAEKSSTAETGQNEERTRYPARLRKPKEYPDFVTYQVFSCEDEPTTYQEAINCQNSDKWEDAMRSEYDSLIKNNSWNLVDLPKGKKAINCKWVYKIKRDADGNIERYKARLVAKGCHQKAGIDYDETFSPVVRHSSMRVLFSLAAEFNLSIDHLDVNTAFLNGDLEEEVYIKQPEGFTQHGKENKVCLLKKALYGLKQASRAWYTKIDKALCSLNFKRCATEPCVYIRKENGSVIIISLYVDDLLLFSNNSMLKEDVKGKLMSMFSMKDLGEAKYVIGYRITRYNGAIFLDQKNYIENLLNKFNMGQCKPATTPLQQGQKFVSVDPKQETDPQIPYQCLIGSLMYLSVCSRPDISHAVSVLSQFNTCYTKVHWEAAKHILRYLKGTLDFCIKYEKTDIPVFGLVDADWAGDNINRRSYTGLAFIIAGGAVSWESKKQPTVALSSTEAEYMALTQGAKEAIFLRNFLYDLLGSYLEIKIYNDSQSAQKLSMNQVFHSRTKHIDVRHHFIRETLSSKLISLHYLPTNHMFADVLTKCLNKQKHKVCLEGLGITKCQCPA